MAKESGIGLSVNVDDSGGTARDISNDVNSADWATPREVADVTGLDSSGMERLLLLADFSVTLNGTFNDASNLSHAVFSTVSSSDVQRTVTLAHSGNTLATECVFTDYRVNRTQNGELRWTAPGVLADGTAPTWA